jgi:Cu/Ag efflux pump CusA
VTITALALLPLALATGEADREIEGPMAIVILGGLATSTLLFPIINCPSSFINIKGLA